jgi:phospholipase C
VNFVVSQESRILPNIEHVVVLMMENRSFDNLLGWLYTPDDLPAKNIPAQTPSTFAGLAFGGCANSAPSVNGGRPVAASEGTTKLISPVSPISKRPVQPRRTLRKMPNCRRLRFWSPRSQ